MAEDDSNALAEELARGLAHNVNNVLASIIGNISVARASLPPEDPIRNRLDAAERASFKLQELTERLQLYARRIEPMLEPVSVERLVSDVLARSESTVTCDITPGLTIRADAALLTRALLELLDNAREAGSPTVSIEAHADGSTAKITITDHGHGIAPDVAEGMFSPFSTTRSRGRGLGLPIVAAMAHIHGGEVQYKAPATGGAQFCLRIPRTTTAIPEAAVTGHRVLLVDDEQALREVLGEMLSLLGHDVTIACDGEEALEQFQRAQLEERPFTLVVLDLMIPGGAGGADILARMRADASRFQAIVSSGYWAEATAQLGRDGFQAVLIKPFTLSDVEAAVEQALDSGLV